MRYMAVCAGVCGMAWGLLLPVQAAEPVKAKRLIEFGWDEPDTAFMRRHLEQLEKSPFDGCVFHVNYSRPGGKTGNFTWECWGKQAFTEVDIRQAIEDLKSTPFRRFKHNFLRFNTAPADIDWFDDFGPLIGNARLAAHMAREGGCPGLLFDIEQYNGQLFNYAKRQRTDKSWSEYAQQVRRRGREVMSAFQEGFPGLTVFLTFGYCLPWEQSNGGKRPLAECDYGLLAPFLDGLVEAAQGKTRIVDGCELAYGYREGRHFTDAHRRITRDLFPMVAEPDKYRRMVSVSYGLWMDFDWRKHGWNTEDTAKNPLPPEKFGAMLRMALDSADEYVWVYTEQPRWWSADGGPVKLPPAYDAAVRQAKESRSGAETRPAEGNNRVSQAHAVLTVAEGKRLIAKAVARMPIVQAALRDGMIIVCKGTTNTYVAEELLGRKVPHGAFVLGRVTPRKGGGELPKTDPMPEVILVRGQHRPELALDEALKRLAPGDVVIKGGNVLDYVNQTAAVWNGSPTGGTAGKILPAIAEHKAHLVVPVGLEKQVAGKLADLVERLGQPADDLTGLPRLRILPGQIVTEIEALKILADVEAFQASAGGIGGAEGAAWMVWRGTRENVEKARSIVESVQGEPPFVSPTGP